MGEILTSHSEKKKKGQSRPMILPSAGVSKDILLNEIKPDEVRFLAKRDLTLSAEKTKCDTH